MRQHDDEPDPHGRLISANLCRAFPLTRSDDGASDRFRDLLAALRRKGGPDGQSQEAGSP